jgi:hypothetical protein
MHVEMGYSLTTFPTTIYHQTISLFDNTFTSRHAVGDINHGLYQGSLIFGQLG